MHEVNLPWKWRQPTYSALIVREVVRVLRSWLSTVPRMLKTQLLSHFCHKAFDRDVKCMIRSWDFRTAIMINPPRFITPSTTRNGFLLNIWQIYQIAKNAVICLALVLDVWPKLSWCDRPQTLDRSCTCWHWQCMFVWLKEPLFLCLKY